MRVFTRDGEGGNHLGIVHDLVDLDDGAMQRIAAHLGFSESVFVDWADAAVPFVRIFTPSEELPFAGRPLVGFAWCLTVIGPGGVQRLRYAGGEASIRLEAAITWVEVAMDATMAPPSGVGRFVSRAGITEVVSADALLLPKEYILVELPSREAVASVQPDMGVVRERFGTLVFVRDENLVRCRFFAPGSGVPEDPATGSAAAALARLFTDRGEPRGRLTIHQGEEIGHPSRIELQWGDGRAAIGGSVVRDEVRLLDE